jgi:TonB-linked SusC/RagA family outer membrane protein
MGYNGSENFPEGQRFGFLPAVSLGWVITEENFFPANNFLSYMKIRGSMGKVGNDNIGGSRFLYLPDTWVYSGGYNFGDLNNRRWVQGAQEGVIGNQNVTWETATKSNIGFETRLIKDKLSITYDYFQEHRVDILSYRGTVPAIVQATLPPYNLGEVRSWGNEIEFNWRSDIGKLNYWIKGNASTNRNEIIFRDEAIVPGLEYQAETGRPINQGLYLISEGLYETWSELYEVDQNGNPVLSNPILAQNENGEHYNNESGEAVYQKDLGLGGAVLQPGEVRLKDVNEDGVIDDKDYARVGKTTIPELSFGLALGFNYKGFDFSILFQGVEGVERFVQTPEAMHFASNYALQEVDLLRFTEERHAAGERIEFPIAAYNKSAIRSTFFLKDASYIRLKNIEVGYTLQPNFLKKVGINTARIYVNGSNLYTWGANSIWGDPENLGNTGYPITKNYNIGFRFNF